VEEETVAALRSEAMARGMVPVGSTETAGVLAASGREHRDGGGMAEVAAAVRVAERRRWRAEGDGDGGGCASRGGCEGGTSGGVTVSEIDGCGDGGGGSGEDDEVARGPGDARQAGCGSRDDGGRAGGGVDSGEQATLEEQVMAEERAVAMAVAAAAVVKARKSQEDPAMPSGLAVAAAMVEAALIEV